MALRKIRKKLGKAQAQKQFGPLVDALCTTGGVVEISDSGKIGVVMLGYKDYLWLLAQTKEPFSPRRQLAGSAETVGDIEAASKELSDSIAESVETSTPLD